MFSDFYKLVSVIQLQLLNYIKFLTIFDLTEIIQK